MAPESEFEERLKLLRGRAEARLSASKAYGAAEGDEETRRLLHDLTVHQIELELQNEELRDAQLQIQASRDRYLELYHHAPVGYIVADSAGMILQANRRIAQMLERDIAELMNRPLSDFIHVDDRTIFHSRFRAFYNQPAGKQLDLSMVTRSGSVIHTTLEGRRIDRTTIQIRTKDPGDPFLITIGDVTKQKTAEKAIIRAKQQWEQTFDAVPDLIAIIDNTFTIVRVNRPLAARLGVSPGDCVGKKCYDVLHTSRSAPADCPHACFLNTGRTCRAEMFNSKLNGHFITTVSPFNADEQNDTWCIHILHDITDRKRAEKELTKLRNLETIGTLAGGVAHDFNNILTALVGNIELAQLHLNGNKEAKTFLQSALQASHKARDLANRLLTFSKGGEPLIQPMVIDRLLEEAVELGLCGANVTHMLNLPEHLEPVIADEVQIRSALQNIVTNAREAMPRGGNLEIDVRHVTVEPDNPDLIKQGRYLRIDFHDQGNGISASHIDKVFDPYFTTKQMGAQKGMGLGLAISHSIIRKHHGYINVQSIEGQGTTVKVLLPLLSQRTGQAADVRPTVTRADSTPKRLLIMDDEAHIWEVIRPVLRQMGCEADFAADGEQTIAKYVEAMRSGNRYNALLLDLTIRGGVGAKAVVHRIMAIDPRARAAVFSGYSNDPVFADFSRFGFVGALRKPFRIEELKTFVRQLLSEDSAGPQVK